MKNIGEEAQIVISLPVTLLKSYLQISKVNQRSLNKQILMDLTEAVNQHSQAIELKNIPKSEFNGSVSLPASRKSLEEYIIRHILEKHKGNISKTAKELKISRPALYEKIAKLKIKSS